MTPRQLNRRLIQERGVVAIVSLLFIFVLFAFTGMAIDIGFVQTRRSLEQTAADSAAMAGAMEIAAGRSANAVAAAKAAAQLNGFQDGASNIAVNVKTTASSADVTITQNMNLFFLPVFGVNTMNIAARATSGTSGSGSNGPAQGSGCIYALSPSASPGFELDANVNANCDILVNSTAVNNSVKWDSNAACAVTTNFSFNGVMNQYPGTNSSNQTAWTYNQNNQWYQQGGCTQRTNTSVCNDGSGNGCKTFYQVPSALGTTPVATMLTSSVADPLSGLSQTSLESQQTCNALTVARNGVNIDYNSAQNQTSMGVTYTGSGNSMMITLQPGVYCGGLTLGSQSHFTLSPGVYYIRGGNLTANSQAQVTGTGVMFYLSTSLANTSDYSTVARINFSGQPSVNLSGGDGLNSTVKDIVFFANRNSTNTNPHSFNGDSTSVLKGSFYAPSDYVYITGTSSTNGNVNMDGIYYSSGSCYGSSYLVASKIKMDGRANFNFVKEANQCTSGGGTPRLTL